MSIALVESVIADFLGRTDPEVLCIRGKWGVGKTYTWSKALETAHKAKQIKLARYSYVSLFGVNALDELKLAIFENVVTFRDGLKKADLETLNAYVSKIASWRKLTKIAQSVPIVKNFVGGEIGGLVSFMTIRDQIICIDDLERRGQKLDVGDVLGLISYLREQRNCKIVLLLNDEQLLDEARQSFDRTLEKVADASLIFEPSPEESARVGIPDEGKADKLVTQHCISLGITNIRVIKRIRSLFATLEPILAEFDPEVLNVAVSSVVLFGWSHDQPDEAPPLKFLKGKTPNLYAGNQKDVPVQEAAWNSLLEAYGYIYTDEFDQALINGVERGYFDPEVIRRTAAIVHEKAVATKSDISFEAAWCAYHDSFANNRDEVLDGIYAAFKANVKYINPSNLNGTVSLFKDLGRLHQAKEILDHYMLSRKEPRSFFDLEEYVFAEYVTDPDVRAAFNARAAEVTETRDIGAILASIKNSWNDDAIATLASASVDEYVKTFKAKTGLELRRLLSNGLQFDRLTNATSQMKAIPQKIRAALEVIGNESPINARRVKRFGVSVALPAEGPVVSDNAEEAMRVAEFPSNTPTGGFIDPEIK